MIYYTGDIHGDPYEVIQFCDSKKLTEQDTLVLLGDVGANYYRNRRDTEMKKVLDNLKVEKALVIIGDDSDNVVLSARNIAGVQTASVNTINVFDLLKYNTVIATKSSVASIEEVYA